MEKFIGLLKEIVSFLKTYGINGVIWILVLLCFLGITIPELPEGFKHFFNANTSVIFFGMALLKILTPKKDKAENKMTFQEEQETRMEAETKVRLAISKLIREAKANRVYVAEYHNGKQNSTSMAFTYLDVTYEDCEEINYISQEYQNLPTSIYKCSDYMIHNYHFIGTTDKLEKIDSKLAHRMMDNGVKYVGLILLKNSGINIGILGLSYKETPSVSDVEILKKLSIFAQDISDYLDLRQYKNK